jgi:beta-glucosidase
MGFGLLVLVGIQALCAAGAEVPVYKDSTRPVHERVDDLLQRMTLEEKISYVSGVNNMFIRAIPRLDIPAIECADSTVGLKGGGMAFPPALALAAAADQDLARRMGEALGRESRALGVHICLGPGMNMARAPLLGRNCEYYGEDPYLTAHLSTELIGGLQSQGVMACAKHYLANEIEFQRTGSDSRVDERTLREIYLPPFERAVHVGNTGSIMGAYNRVNGTPSCINDWMLRQVLREEWGFQGIIVSDWGAGGGGAEQWSAGELDLAMSSGPMGRPEIVMPLIEQQKIDPAVYDRKVRHLLTKFFEFGFFDHPRKDPSLSVGSEENYAIALDISRKGTVLMKNESNLLPIDTNKVKSIAVVGLFAELPTGNLPYVTGISGSSSISVPHPISMSQAVRDQAGSEINVISMPDDIATLFKTTNYVHRAAGGNLEPGMWAEYYTNTNFFGEPELARVESDLNFGHGWRLKSWLVQDKKFRRLSVRLNGIIKPEQSGVYQFVKKSNPGVKVWLDDELIIDDMADFEQSHWVRPTAGVKRELTAGREYNLKIDYVNVPDLVGHMKCLQFGWGELDYSAVQEKVSRCDLAIVCAGFDHMTEGEGFDRTFELPYGQRELIEAVTEVQPQTVVVLTGGGACATEGWVDQTPAMLETWYLARDGAQAVAEILFGKVNPSGKLPVTFDRRWEDNPAYPYYKLDWSKKPYTTDYTEGIFIGYRGYDQSEKEPLFPFGHGLSYTTFNFGDLSLEPLPDDGSGNLLRVTCTVRNAGKRAGGEVAQLYVGDEDCSVPRPIRELKGFQRVELQPGESRQVTFTLDRRAFCFWDETSHVWRAEPGIFKISVGSSSRDLPLAADFDLSHGIAMAP